MYGGRVRESICKDSDLDVGYYLNGEEEEATPLPIHDESVLVDRMSRLTGVPVAR